MINSMLYRPAASTRNPSAAQAIGNKHTDNIHEARRKRRLSRPWIAAETAPARAAPGGRMHRGAADGRVRPLPEPLAQPARRHRLNQPGHAIDAPAVYRTPHARQYWETQARSNIRAELHQLRPPPES